MEVHERCVCGASFEIRDSCAGIESIPVFMEQVGAWRQEHTHRAPVKESTTAKTEKQIPAEVDWREQYVGRQCTVCHLRLTPAKVLTTLGGKPLHVSCRRCYICGGEKPYSMGWKQTPAGIYLLAHPKCFRAKELQDQEKEHAQVIEVEPGQAIIEGTVVQDHRISGEDPVYIKVRDTSGEVIFDGQQYENDLLTGGILYHRDNPGGESVVGQDLDPSERDAGNRGEGVSLGSGGGSETGPRDLLQDDEGMPGSGILEHKED